MVSRPFESEALDWIRSTKCSGSTCVEVRFDADRVLVRDSKEAASAFANVIAVGSKDWQVFLSHVSIDGFARQGILRTERDDASTVVLRTDETSLIFSRREWSAFIEGVQQSEFDVHA